MKITQLLAHDNDGKTTISLHVESDLLVSDAISSVLALFSGAKQTVSHGLPAPSAREIYGLPPHSPEYLAASAYENISRQVSDAELQAAVAATKAAEEPATEPKAEAKATRTRRPRTNPDASPAPATAAAEVSDTLQAASEAPAVERRRTRVTQEPAAETVKVITDADLAKACSNAAAIIGIEVVQAVINDFAVKSMQELAPDVREKFLGELDDEITLAKEELAKVGK